MYGENKLSEHHRLFYGLSKEFVELFAPLQIDGIELPLVLLRDYHVYIRSLAGSGLENPALLPGIQKRHPLYSFSEVQKALQRMPPLAEDLSSDRSRKILAITVPFLPFVLERFPDSEVIVILLSGREEDYFPKVRLPRKYRLLKLAEEARSACLNPIAVSEQLKELDLLLGNLFQHPVFGQQQFRLWLRRMIPVAMKNIQTMRRWLIENRIAMIICHTEMKNPGATLALLAAQYNLPFINAPVHLITDQNIIPTRARFYCVWGKNYRTWLQKRGINPSKIICTGNLRFEYEQRQKKMSREIFQSQLKLQQNDLLFAYTTQPLQEEVRKTLLKWIEEALTGLPITVLIKKHHNDHLDYHTLVNSSQIILTPESIKLYDLLPNVDYLMTVSSTTAIEATLLQKGLIVLQPEQPDRFDGNSINYHAHLAKAKAGFIATSPQKLRDILAGICFNKKLRKNLEQFSENFIVNTIDQGTRGVPSEKMYKFIAHLLNHGRH